MNETFYNFRAEAGGEPASAELLIFDAIGSWEEIGEISAKAFARDLAKLPSSVKRLDIHINSPGGSVYDAQGIYSRLADHRAEKIVYVDGLAASAASIVAMVGHKIYMRANANMMIHLPSALTVGNEDDHEKSIRALRSITSAMLNSYARKTGLDRGEIRDMLAAETWFTAEEAVEKGFADEVRGVIKAAAMLDDKRVVVNGCTFDLSRFKNVPAFNATTNQPSKPMKKVKATAEENEDENNGEENGNGEETKPKKGKQEKPEPEPVPNPEHPAPAHAHAESDFDKGVQAERNRVTALQALDRPATHDIIVAAIKDGKQPSDVVAECMTAMDKAAKQQARRTDASALNEIPPSDGGEEGNGEQKNNFGGLIKTKIAARMKGRNPLRANRN